MNESDFDVKTDHYLPTEEKKDNDRSSIIDIPKFLKKNSTVKQVIFEENEDEEDEQDIKVSIGDDILPKAQKKAAAKIIRFSGAIN